MSSCCQSHKAAELPVVVYSLWLLSLLCCRWWLAQTTNFCWILPIRPTSWSTLRRLFMVSEGVLDCLAVYTFRCSSCSVGTDWYYVHPTEPLGNQEKQLTSTRTPTPDQVQNHWPPLHLPHDNCLATNSCAFSCILTGTPLPDQAIIGACICMCSDSIWRAG